MNKTKLSFIPKIIFTFIFGFLRIEVMFHFKKLLLSSIFNKFEMGFYFQEVVVFLSWACIA